MTQDDGSYKYYYYLFDDSEIVEDEIREFVANGEVYIDGSFEILGNGAYDISMAAYYHDGDSVVLDDYRNGRFLHSSQYGMSEDFFNSVSTLIVTDEGIEFVAKKKSTELLKQLQETLSANPEATHTLRTYYINSSTGNLGREYADDYGKTYEATREGDYIKVRVEKVKKSYKPMPDSGKDVAGYEWQPTPESSNIYEIDYTDTWERGQYSYFRLSVNPDLGTEWMETDGIVVGGSNSQALGKDSFVTGSDNIANGAHSAVFGDENYVNYAGIASGRKNKVLNKSGVAFGEKNIIRGYGSVAMGGSNEIGEEAYTVAIGQYLKSHNSGEAIVGSYNIPLDKLDKKDDGTIKTVALSVGAGWSETTRRDAMTVYKDGTTKVLGDVYSGSTNVTQTAKNAKSGADSATAAASAAKSSADEAKKIANQANTDITSLENAVEIMNDRLTADVDELYELSKNIKDDRTTLQLGELPEKGVVDKLYITDDSEQWIYKIRKTPKVENVWDGVIPKSNPFPTDGSKGKGTIDDPYQITNGNELAYVVSGKMRINYFYYKLMNDIYLNDLNCIDWESGQIKTTDYTPKPWINTANAKVEWNGGFCGEFDGNNHSIYGLYFVDSTGLDHTNGTALFPRMIEDSSSHKGNPTAIIKNLELDYFHINTLSWAGSLIGYEQWAHYEVSNCAIGKNVHLKGNRVSDIGTYGNAKLKISNTYSLSNKIYTERCAFAAAHHWSSTAEAIKMDNCYNLNGPLFISSASRNINNCYHTDKSSTIGTFVAKEDMMGINALDNMPLLNSNAVEPSDNIITLPYDNLPVGETIRIDSEELFSDGSPANKMSIMANEDGIINVSIYGCGVQENIDSTIKYKITTVEDYVPSICTLNYIDTGDSNYTGVTFYMEGKDLYVEGKSNSNMPGMDLTFVISIERTGTSAAYVNDYTYPHLTSFVEGWKCIDKDIEIPECEVTQEELDEVKNEVKELADTVANTKCEVSKQDLSNTLAEAKEYTDTEVKKVNDLLYKEVKWTGYRDTLSFKDLKKDTRLMFKMANGDANAAWGQYGDNPAIYNKNLAVINISANGYVQDGLTFTLLPNGGIEVKGIAQDSYSLEVSHIQNQYGLGEYYNPIVSDASDSGILFLSNGSGNDKIITKNGVKCEDYNPHYNIIIKYEVGVQYDTVVFVQAELGNTATEFVPVKKYTISDMIAEDLVRAEGSSGLISGTFYFNIPKTGDYDILANGMIGFVESSYTALGDYGTSIITGLQSQIDELKQALGDVNSILATLVEGSAE